MKHSPAIGLKNDAVALSHYRSVWPRMFAAERTRLRPHFRARGIRIEHIGSTAVPGLAAKPIIDLAIRVPSFRWLKSYIRRLETLGYQYEGEYGLTGRHFFKLGQPVVTHHLHLVAVDSPHWTRWLVFRDYLRAHPAAARRYSRFKRQLAVQHGRDRQGYTKAKTPVVEALLARAYREAGIRA